MCRPDTEPNGNNDGSIADAPWILRLWLRLYRAIPSLIRDPNTGLDFTFSLFSAFALSCLRLCVDRFLLLSGWPERTRYTIETGMNLTSALHAAFLCSGLGVCLFCRGGPAYVPSARMDDKTAPLWWRDAAESLLQVCTGYMFFDGFFMYRDTERMGQGWTEFEVMIMGHHFCTVLYMLSCRALRAGHLSTMTLMFFGELTNPFMNGLFISRYAM